MQDVVPMCIREGGGNLDRVVEKLLDRQRPFRYPCCERFAFEVFHDEIADSLMLPHVINRADSGMVEAGGQPHFVVETPLYIRMTLDGRADHLNPTLPPERGAPSRIPSGHPPPPAQRLDS